MGALGASQQLAPARAAALRDGREWKIEAPFLVPGDAIELATGDRGSAPRPRDLRLLG